MEIKYTSSPWGFRFYDLEKYCQFLSTLGIKNICTFFGDPAKLPLAFPDNLSQQNIQNIHSVVNKYGLKIIEICGGGDYSIEQGIEKEIETTKKHIDLGTKLGVEIFRLFAGFIDEKKATDKTYEQISESLTVIGEYAKKYKIVIAMENHGGVTRTGEQVERIMKKVKSDNVGVNYDPANFMFYDEDPLKALERIQDYVVFTHFKSCKKVADVEDPRGARKGVEDGKMKYCRLQEGMIDYKPIFEKLTKSYSGYYSLEYEEPSDVEQGTKDDFKCLKELLEIV